jgi:hypothetical protein
LNKEKMLEGKREVAGYDARVFVSWNEGLEAAPQDECPPLWRAFA